MKQKRSGMTTSAEILALLMQRPHTIHEITEKLYTQDTSANAGRVYYIIDIFIEQGIVIPMIAKDRLFFKIKGGTLGSGSKK